MKCRHCGNLSAHPFLDLGFAPPSNNYLNPDDLNKPEITFPLKLFVCEECWLVQTLDFARPGDLFRSDYAYFSSISSTWRDHTARYAQQMRRVLGLGSGSFVIEIASNDGCLLKNFSSAGIPCLGIEPTASTAEAAEKSGVPTLREFFGSALATTLAKEGRRADLLIGNNVFAHVPDINDFTLGLQKMLKDGGTVTLEFPHLLETLRQLQFDTVYHEHFSYLSLHTVQRVFDKAGLRVFDVERLSTHGGSLRVYGCHAGDPRPTTSNVQQILADEEAYGLRTPAPYAAFQSRVDQLKNELLVFLIGEKSAGRAVAAYGAAAKGNTLLNYAGVRSDLIAYVCDAAPSKQGKYLPGSHLPIRAPAALRDAPPRTVLVLPWNIREEVEKALADLRPRGTRFAVAVPRLSVN